MTTSWRRAVRGLALLAACAVAIACRGESGPIAIALAGNLTDEVGVPMRLAAELAVEEINAAGGIDGRKLELILRDDFANPDSAVAIATELRSSSAVAVIGHLYSAPTLAAAPVYNGGINPMLQISPTASSPHVSDAGPYTFRLCPSDLAHGVALARWTRERLHFGRGAILYLNDEYGRGMRSSFADRFAALGGAIIASYPYLSDSTVLGTYLERLARDPRLEFLVVAGYRDDAVAVMAEARARGVQVPILGGDGLEGVETAGEVAEGSFQSAAYLPTIDTPENRKFVDAYRRRFPNAGNPNQAAAGSYDAVYLLRDLIDRVGPDRAALQAAATEVGRSTPAFTGAAGRVAFDARGDVPQREVHIGVVHGGRVVPASAR